MYSPFCCLSKLRCCREPDRSEASSPVESERYVIQVRPTAHFYTAMWPYSAREMQELSFREADRFEVIYNSDEWWLVNKVDRSGNILETGIIPNGYLVKENTVESQPWYFGKMNRLECERHLMMKENGEGAFMVRVSEKDHVGCVVSVKINNQVKHYMIYQDEENSYSLYENHRFRSIQELVNHYRGNPFEEVEILGSPCIRKSPKPADLSYSMTDEWELPKENFTLEERLGSGYFSDVYKGLWKGCVKVAIKVLKSEEYLSLIEFQQETQILKKLRHRHLLSLFGICSTTTPYYIITELMEKGNLLHFLRGDEGMNLNLPCLMDMAIQVADGMFYLESHDNIHRDLAARNILVDEDYTCKVGDFGLARVVKEPFYISDNKWIPYKWTAPEAISHSCFSIKSDVWSYGVLLYEILTYGAVPYPGHTNLEAYEKVMEGYRMPAPRGCPENIYMIMLSCWNANPQERPSFSSLKSSLSSVNL